MNLPEENQKWRKSSKCADISCELADKLFFGSSGSSPQKARNFCSTCPVKRECLHYAILHNQDGFWAGTTKEERNSMKWFMVDRIIEQGLIVQEYFASPEPDRVPTEVYHEVFEEYPWELPEESYFPTVDVAV